MVRAREVSSLGHLPRREVAASDVADLAGVNQVVESGEGFFLRRLRVGRVNLVEVDVVSLETLKAVLGGGDYMAPRATARVRSVAHRHSELGCNDHVLALIAERLAQQFFRLAAAA